MTTPAFTNKRGYKILLSPTVDKREDADIRVGVTKRYAKRYKLSFEETYEFFKEVGVIDYAAIYLGTSSDGYEFQDERVDRLVEKFYALNPDYPRLW